MAVLEISCVGSWRFFLIYTPNGALVLFLNGPCNQQAWPETLEINQAFSRRPIEVFLGI